VWRAGRKSENGVTDTLVSFAAAVMGCRFFSVSGHLADCGVGHYAPRTMPHKLEEQAPMALGKHDDIAPAVSKRIVGHA
jgi:hypothetical protein